MKNKNIKQTNWTDFTFLYYRKRQRQQTLLRLILQTSARNFNFFIIFKFFKKNSLIGSVLQVLIYLNIEQTCFFFFGEGGSTSTDVRKCSPRVLARVVRIPTNTLKRIFELELHWFALASPKGSLHLLLIPSVCERFNLLHRARGAHNVHWEADENVLKNVIKSSYDVLNPLFQIENRKVV